MKRLRTRAFVLRSHGYDGLVEEVRDVPEPGPRQVLVRMQAASLNFRDLKILHGTYARNPLLPVVPLSDGAAEVVYAGTEVDGFRTGTRVLPIYMDGWHTGPFLPGVTALKAKGGDVDGTAREFAVFESEDLLPIPPSLSFAQAACLPCAGVTAWHALAYLGRIKPGQTVLAMGSGGVAVAALQIARMFGAEVIAMSSDDDKLSRVMALGASAGVNYRTTPDWAATVRRLAGGQGVDHVIEVGGAATINASIKSTKDGGSIWSIGNLSGEFASSSRIERGISFSDVAVGSKEMTRDLMNAIDRNRSMPVIDRSFDFTDLKEALAYLESGRHFGKVVLRFT